MADTVMVDPLLFGDFLAADPAGNLESGDPNKISDPKLYEDCGTFEVVNKKFNNLLLDYNEADGNKEMTLVLF